MLRFEIDQSGYRPPSKERFRQSSMWIYAFLFGSLMVDGDTLLPHSASVTFPPRAGRIVIAQQLPSCERGDSCAII